MPRFGRLYGSEHTTRDGWGEGRTGEREGERERERDFTAAA